MADQQDQLSSGGSVEKASASADASKIRGKSSSSGSGSYRKRQSTGSIPVAIEEKRRRQTIGDPQSSQALGTTSTHRSSIDSSKGEGRSRGECRSHDNGLNNFPDTDWRTHQKNQQSSYNISSNGTRIRSTVRTSLPDLNITPIDCVASRTRSRTPQNPQTSLQGSSGYDLSLPSGYGSRKTSVTYNNYTSTSSSLPVANHPSTSKGRGWYILSCFVLAKINQIEVYMHKMEWQSRTNAKSENKQNFIRR